jgi:hypothetical protein
MPEGKEKQEMKKKRLFPFPFFVCWLFPVSVLLLVFFFLLVFCSVACVGAYAVTLL